MLTQNTRVDPTEVYTARDLDITYFVSRSRPLDLTGIVWDDVARSPITSDVIRTLRYMHEIERHTVIFPRTIFSTRAVNDEVIGRFLTCWLYEESFHGPALARFLEAAGQSLPPQPCNRFIRTDRLEAIVIPILAALWSDFLALHMTWGAIHELTTITAYHRLATQAGHPNPDRIAETPHSRGITSLCILLCSSKTAARTASRRSRHPVFASATMDASRTRRPINTRGTFCNGIPLYRQPRKERCSYS